MTIRSSYQNGEHRKAELLRFGLRWLGTIQNVSCIDQDLPNKWRDGNITEFFELKEFKF